MSAPGPLRENSPLKVGGFLLLGVAAVAAVVGLISLAGGGSSNAVPPPSIDAASSTSAAPPAAQAPATPAPATPAPAVPAPAAAPPAPGATPATGASPSNQLAAPPAPLPGAGLPGAGLPADNGSRSATGSGKGTRKAVAKAPVRVYNNSLIKNLAEQAADDFRGSGWRVDEVGNYSTGNIPTSTVYFRPGTAEQAAAQSLASSFGLRAAPRFDGLDNATPGLIVIVTKDYQRR